MALISVQEYENLYIDEIASERKSITSAQAEILTHLKPAYGYEIFKYVNRNAIRAQQYVGVIQIGPHTVEVLPKIGGDTRKNLVAMLAVTLDLAISEGEIAKVATQKHGFLEILIRLFCDKLFIQVHRGLVCRYEGREENLTVLRGKLGVTEQVRLNAANPERLFCRFDEFIEDNPLNQIFKAAIRLLLKVSKELNNQQQLVKLLLVLDGVSNCPRASLPWHRIAFDRMSERYKPCFKMAELFLKNTPPDVGSGGAQGFSLFFDMNVLFEEYIGRMMARTFRPEGFKVTLQGPQRHLAFDEDAGKAVFTMKPDVIGSRDIEAEWILDTKWKQLSIEEAKAGVAQSDLYQMYAYANCYNCTDVVLLYPHHKELGPNPGVRQSYLLNPWIQEVSDQKNRRVRVASIDLENLNTVTTQLRKIILTQNLAAKTEIAT